MWYAIVANPASGEIRPQRKRRLLREAADILDAEIYGLDARNPEEFAECAIRAAGECDVLVCAGGNGTLSAIINVIDRSVTPVGFLPLGTGNALRHALRLRGGLAAIALQIRGTPIRLYDLVGCAGRVGFSASVGIEAAALQVRRKHPRLRKTGFWGYLTAALIAFSGTYRRTCGFLEVDGLKTSLKHLLTLLVVKHPYHGYRMRVVPEARLDDGKLHVLEVSSGPWKSLFWGAAALVSSNRVGRHFTGKSVKANLDQPLFLQADGEVLGEARSFTFEVLEKSIMVKA